MVAPDTMPEKEFDDLDANQQLEMLVTGLFAGFALIGVIAKYGGEMMTAKFMDRVKEKANGR